jgi:hypothetical protein
MHLKFPQAECKMARMIWEQSKIPEDKRHGVKVYFINTSIKKDPKNETLIGLSRMLR